MIQWQYFPRSDAATPLARDVVAAFEAVSAEIDSAKFAHVSNTVLKRLSGGLQACGFRVEAGKTDDLKINVPVLFGKNGRVDKSFDADALHDVEGFVLEVEAGRGVTNNQFLKDFFQACMMLEINYLGIAVRNTYKGSKDFERVIAFFDTLYASRRLSLPIRGILIIGY